MCTVTNLNLGAPSKQSLSLSLAHLPRRLSRLSVPLFGLCHSSADEVYRLCASVSVVCSRAADESSSKLASVPRIVDLLELKNAIVFSLEMLYLLPLLLVYPSESSLFLLAGTPLVLLPRSS